MADFDLRKQKSNSAGLLPMSYVSFSLKYRPQTFADVVGQDHVSRTLTNAIRGDRVHHAYLFSGPRGTGKTSSARVLAKALNCVNGPTPDPCGVCDFCVAVQDGRAMDVIEVDAASNRGIDEIRELREKVKYSPAQARFKIYILDEVHMLTTEAFNALLKTLEEPPAHSFFILATTEPHKVPATIMSRCQRFDFRQIPVSEIAGALSRIAQNEGIETEPDALEAIARAADGAMRDAESIFDQVVAYTEGKVTLDVVSSVLGVTDSETLAQIADLMAGMNVAGVFALVDRVVEAGKDVAQLMADLTLYFRDLLRIALNAEPAVWQLSGEEGKARLRQQATALGGERLLQTIQTLAQAQNDLRSSTQHTLLLELTLAGLCQPPVQIQQRIQANTETTSIPSAPIVAEKPVAAPAEMRPVVVTATPEPPKPVPPPQPPEKPIVAGQIDLQAVVSTWEAISFELRRMSQMQVAALFREATPIRLQDGKLTVIFRPQHQFHHGKLLNSGDVVETALERLFHQKIKLECLLAASDEEADRLALSVNKPEVKNSVTQEPVQETPVTIAPVAEPLAVDPVIEPEPQAEMLEQTTVIEPENCIISPVESVDVLDTLENVVAEVEQTPAAPVTETIIADDSPVEKVVSQALSLFEGSQIIGDENI